MWMSKAGEEGGGGVVWMSIAGREGWVDEYKNEEKFNVDKYTL